MLPVLVLSLSIVALLAGLAIRRSHRLALVLSSAGLLLAFLSLFGGDRSGSIAIALLILAALAVVLLASGWLARAERPEELYLLILLATLGASILASADHFAVLFLGLELLSVSLYGLIGYDRTELRSLEASLKYLILAGATSAMLIFGSALVYAGTGSMQLSTLASAALEPPIALGLVLMLAGLAFKLAAAPFHFWAPDVYAGAPPPITAFLATVSKGSVFALLLHFPLPGSLWLILLVVASASMLIGNLLAVRELRLRRMLAYSSIAQIGYLLFALPHEGAALFYLAVYFAATIAAFGVITVLAAEGDADDLDAYRGLFWRRWWLAVPMTLSMLALAGLPITAGFFGKLYLLLSGLDSAGWIPAACFVAGSAIGIYYYLRVVGTMLAPAPAAEAKPIPPAGAGISLLFSSLVLIVLGLFPGIAIQGS